MNDHEPEVDDQAQRSVADHPEVGAAADPTVPGPASPPAVEPPRPSRAVPVLLSLLALLVAAGLILAVVGYRSLRSDLSARDARLTELERQLTTIDADLTVDRARLAEIAGAPRPTTAPLDVNAAANSVLPQFQGNGQPDAAIGRPIPDISGNDFLTDTPVAIATDRPTMVMVWAHWCPYCQNELPIVQSLSDEGYFDEQGVALLTISTFEEDSRGNPFEEYVDEFTIPVIRDDGMRSMRLGFGGVPSWVIVDADGIVVGRVSGALGEPGLRDLIERVGALGA